MFLLAGLPVSIADRSSSHLGRREIMLGNRQSFHDRVPVLLFCMSYGGSCEIAAPFAVRRHAVCGNGRSENPQANDMRGSRYREYVPRHSVQATLFSIRLGGRTLWGWFAMDAGGALRGYSKGFFRDYVTCLCDSQRRPGPSA
jgi:hypothetical protein